MKKQPTPIEIKALIETFPQYLRDKAYKGSTIRNYKKVLYNVDVYMKNLRLKYYEEETGKSFYYDYLEHHKINKGRKKFLRTVIGRLNDFVSGREFSIQRKYVKQKSLSLSIEKVLELYSLHCKGICNKENTILQKIKHIRTFLINSSCADIKELTSTSILKACTLTKNKDGWAVVRDFFRFCCEKSILKNDFSTLIPKFKRPVPLPSCYSEKEILAIENSIDRTTAIGKRDYALLVLATRLGMRSGDIVNLSFNSIDFKGGKIRFIQQKTRALQELSLVKTVEEALLDYINNGRPDSGVNKIFLRSSAPHSPITTSVLRFEFSKYFKTAKINTSGKKHGPHSFRSSFATSMINDNVPYEAVRKLLGHADPDAIKHYAKLDIERLRICSIETIKPTGLFKSFLEGAAG